jgi:hypothetical protein
MKMPNSCRSFSFVAASYNVHVPSRDIASLRRSQAARIRSGERGRQFIQAKRNANEHGVTAGPWTD